MSEIDLDQKQLLEWEDTFADIVNNLLFKGQEIIKPSELKPAKRDSLYKDRELRNRMQERDVAKIWEQCGIHMAYLGLDDQTSIHRAMPLRIIGYDGAAYRDELNKIEDDEAKADDANNKDDEKKNPLQIYPAISMVLHFDYKQRWTGPRTLKECFKNIHPLLEPYINDYKIHVFDIAWLSDDTIKRFKNDFRFLADYYAQMRKTGKWIPMSGKIHHIKALFDLFSSTTNDTRFLEMYKHRKEEQNDMASIALDYLTEEYTAKGEALGILRSVRNLMQSTNWSAQQAMDALLIPAEDQQRYRTML